LQNTHAHTQTHTATKPKTDQSIDQFAARGILCATQTARANSVEEVGLLVEKEGISQCCSAGGQTGKCAICRQGATYDVALFRADTDWGMLS
jgi:hypothetical protein